MTTKYTSMPSKSTKSPEDIFDDARRKADKIYDEIWLGKRDSSGFHRVHISPKGIITDTISVNKGPRDEDEYCKRSPHTLTLWEISGQREHFEPEDNLGPDYFQVQADFIAERKAPKNIEVWSESLLKAFHNKCVEVFMDLDTFSYPYSVDEKRKTFDEWSEKNLLRMSRPSKTKPTSVRKKPAKSRPKRK